MFPCQSCNKTTNPGEKATKVVVETRSVTYPFVPDAIRFRKEGKKVIKHDMGGRGIEIVQELTVCPNCAIAGGAHA